MSRLVLNGCSYEYEAGGTGKALLMIHGFMGSRRTWRPHLAPLRRVGRTITVDLLGHGASEAPHDPDRYRLESQAADIAELLEAVAGGRAAVLGYSLGARIALQLALDYPGVVDRLILEGPSAGVFDPAERAIRRAADDDLADDLERDGIGRFVDGWQAQPLFASQTYLPDSIRARLRAERVANDPFGLAASLRGAGQGAMSSLHGRLGEVKAATLVISGSLDPARPRSEVVAAGIPVASMAVVEGAGHAVHLEAPARFRDLVIGFLTAESTTSLTPETAR